MSSNLLEPELHALDATKLEAFLGINLNHIRDSVDTLLGTISRNGFFTEYTDHSFAHVESMISMLDWILVEEAKDNMSPGDWLTLILSIYFHDLGMIITEDEYSDRDSSGFAEFCSNMLFTKNDGIDYKAKIDQLGAEKATRFFYQEFVRHNHAQRVKNWINGDYSSELGNSNQMVKEVEKLLVGIDDIYREDIGVLAESHHSDDLTNLPYNKPYGETDAETVNLHFLGVVLRTVDLLQITKKRTPGILFRTVDPKDPISQIEWLRHSSVRRVRPAVVGSNPPEDIGTVEIHASFNEPTGFFGLNSYIEYAQTELIKAHSWVQEAMDKYAKPMPFPWNIIDDQFVEAKGFLKEPFKFELDNRRILELLTGHTLYNDTSVVLRELTQNAIDATRLYHGDESSKNGIVKIDWNSETNIFSVMDNGTGMSEAEIKNNLLKVGASRYRSAEFLHEHGDFSSISKFGIGILSVFMVADEVTIITVSPEDEMGRNLKLKTVHGNYLVTFLEKSSSTVPEEMREHGTLISIKIRPSAKIEDWSAIAQKYIYFPNCNVTYKKDNEKSEVIGYRSIKEAYEKQLKAAKSEISHQSYLRTPEIRISNLEKDGLQLSIVEEWLPESKRWTYFNRNVGLSKGVCIEGIMIKNSMFDYKLDNDCFYLINCTNMKDVHTNVARTDFERNDGYSSLLGILFSLIEDKIRKEHEENRKQNLMSMTQVVNATVVEVRSWLSRTLGDLKANEIAKDRLMNLPGFVIESENKRQLISLCDLDKFDQIRQVYSPLYSAADMLLQHLSLDKPISHVMETLGAEDVTLGSSDSNSAYLVGGFSDNYILGNGWDRTGLQLSIPNNKIEIVWSKTDVINWRVLPGFKYDKTGVLSTVKSRHEARELSYILIATDNPSIKGNTNNRYGAIRTGKYIYLLQCSGINDKLIYLIDEVKNTMDENIFMHLKAVLDLVAKIINKDQPENRAYSREDDFRSLFTTQKEDAVNNIKRHLTFKYPGIPQMGVTPEEIYVAIQDNKFDTFDPLSRRV